MVRARLAQLRLCAFQCHLVIPLVELDEQLPSGKLSAHAQRVREPDHLARHLSHYPSFRPGIYGALAVNIKSLRDRLRGHGSHGDGRRCLGRAHDLWRCHEENARNDARENQNRQRQAGAAGIAT